MTEYKTFDDYVKNTFNIEPRELTHISPEEQKKKTVAITVDELINIWNELTEFKPKAGRPQWHDLGKDPTDLPKDEKDVQVLFQDCNKINSYTCLYDIHSESWLYYNLDNMLLEPFDYKVIAWKEIVLPELKETK